MDTQEKDPSKLASKLLTEPYPPEFSPAEDKVRRNLLVVVSLSLIFAIGDLQIAGESALFGIKFKSLPDLLAYKLLLFATIYQLAHFLLIASTTFRYWRVRVAGIKVVFRTGAMMDSSSDSESIQDPKQSSLYTWWNHQAKFISNYEEAQRCIQKSIALNKMEFDRAQMLMQTNKSAEEISKYLKQIADLLARDRILASLYRFDKWYQAMTFWQHVRWFGFELSLPIAGAILSITLLSLKLLSG